MKRQEAREVVLRFLRNRHVRASKNPPNKWIARTAEPLLGIGDQAGRSKHWRVKNCADAILGKPHTTKAFKPVPSINFYLTEEWRKVRYEALKRANGCCQCCGARARYGAPLHVDHIKPRSKYPELALSLENLQVLCGDCNMGKGAWDETDWRPDHLRVVE